MTKLAISLKILRIVLVAITLVSGIVKVIGVRMEFMRVTQVGFVDSKITAFGIVQIVVALLLAFQKTITAGAVAYSLFYSYVTYYYFTNNLHPKFLPILLIVLPMVLLALRKSQIQS